MHHGTCVTHVPWCMSGLLNRGGGENVPGIPGACAPAILRICQEAHVSLGFDEVRTSLQTQIARHINNASQSKGMNTCSIISFMCRVTPSILVQLVGCSMHIMGTREAHCHAIRNKMNVIKTSSTKWPVFPSGVNFLQIDGYIASNNQYANI